jgi:steroid delta-isomerase-like uncharacterized protein
MSTEENKVLVRRLFDAINQRNWTGYYKLIAPDFVFHDASRTIQGREAYQQLVSMLYTAFPDMHYTIEDLFAEGDRVVARYTIQGTHQGALMGIAPTGKPISVTGIIIYRFANGKYVEGWYNGDVLGMLQQLGVVPSMG